jgi:ParB family protein of integrating conjugative element (PFGI_1 class)
MPQQLAPAPDDTRMMRLEVTQLRAYDRNPRRCQNGEYDRIKASIRAQGLDQPLVVTCRPGETGYMLLAGGNTRLQAMLALYQETGDEAFRYLDCLFKPWVAESDVLLSHLRENELRDNLYFIDKALAVVEAKTLLEAEMQGRPLSQRRLSELITARGLSFSQTLISRMIYAVQTLLPLIPQALSAGMGSPQVIRIQGLERAARAIWCKKSLGAEGEFDEIFAALCRRYDSPDWVTDVLQGALETEIAEAAEVDLALVRLELDAQLTGRSIPVITPETLENAPAQDRLREAVTSSGTESAAVGNHVNSSLDTKELSELERLRQRANQLANQLAHTGGLGLLVKPISEQGPGFAVQDVPDETFSEVLDEDLAQLVAAVWRQLVACSDEDWQTLVALTETYRVLHRISREPGKPLLHA